MDISGLWITFVKYFTITLSCFIIFQKILNYKKLSPVKSIIMCSAAIALSFLMFALSNWSLLQVFILIVLCVLLMSLLTKTKIDLALTATLISMGISYLIYMISSIIIGNFFLLDIAFDQKYDLRIHIATFVLQMLLTPLPFRIKKFRRGLPFLKNKNSGWLGIIISSLIIVLYCIIGMVNDRSENEVLIMLLCYLIFCGASVIYWWRTDSKRLYIENIRNRDVETLYSTIDKQQEQMEAVVKSNMDLAHRLHRNDEKIKAMEKEISKYKYRILASSDVELAEDLSAMLDRLEELKEEISVEALKSKTLPPTRVPAIDAMFNHMLDTAARDGIILDLIVTGDINHMINEVIPRGKLETMIGDHLKDAIIAVNSSDNETKSILAHIGFVSGCYEFSVKDNGIEFEIDTLLRLGERPVTTHEKTGGSGWGFMTTFDTMRETKASLIITEDDPEQNNYTKKVAIRFDGKNEYTMSSYRADAINVRCERQDIIVEPNSQSRDTLYQETNYKEAVRH